MVSALALLTSAVAPLWGILAFRFLPFVGFVAVSPRRPWFVRLLVVSLYVPVAVLAAKHGATPFYWLVLAYLYFGGAGWVAHELSTYVRSNVVWFAAVAALFFVLPGALVHPAPRTFFVLAWDYTLAAYSFGVDTRRIQKPPLREYLFFLLVNPALVYHSRGSPIAVSSVDWKGVARGCLGVFALFLSFAPLEIATALATRWSLTPGSLGAGFLGPLAIGGLRLCREYAAHSGVASLQIGCMRQIGWRLPERYRFPLFAQSPADFWRRWNTYVGGWAQSYVFVPLMLAVPRRWRQARRALRTAYALAVVPTFAVVGILHDAFTVSVDRHWGASMTAWFVGMGLLVVAWEALRGFVGGRASRSRLATHVERLVFLTAAFYAAARLP